ncbi:nuclear transport factor 2, putative [Eimeria maxima]|uniref:Nuclear transport factor 2 n=1 Tax=Eimeria maxima TaxID=5804 RepID=U6M2I4_EIMMA|nr:nuclear transport factor 2, putative [Eimeria maxima]CDJ58221.1 nuclear transport factor 2, putative [Eimeria maxima]
MLQLNPHFDSIGPQFVQLYYETFRNNRANLGELYTEDSLLTYEGTQFRGATAIVQKLSQLPAVVNHQLVTCDCQPTPNGGVLIVVCGDLAIEDNPPMKFTQTFNLVPNGSGTYAVFNDCFRLCIG